MWDDLAFDEHSAQVVNRYLDIASMVPASTL
jgi:hypothetical protein